MQHIGMVIRQKRRAKNLSAECIARQLKHPITKQAFTKKERNGHFSYELVMEITQILECDISELNPTAQLTENTKARLDD